MSSKIQIQIIQSVSLESGKEDKMLVTKHSW